MLSRFQIIASGSFAFRGSVADTFRSFSPAMKMILSGSYAGFADVDEVLYLLDASSLGRQNCAWYLDEDGSLVPALSRLPSISGFVSILQP